MRRVTAVSYTHLDVYKRQVWRRTSSLITTSGDVYKRQELANPNSGAEHSKLYIRIQLLLVLIPVSYTHLDVYKRQP